LAWKSFNQLGGNATFDWLFPTLFDRDVNTLSGGDQYFYQDVWALNKLGEFQPPEHYDVGSRIDGFVGQATAICPVVYYDIRLPQFQVPRLQFRVGSILSLPLADQSVSSLSCLHVAEHVGLGRYGDDLDPEGTAKALKELMRVLSPGGQLLLSVPVGTERVEFNAQRILHPERPVEILHELRLKEFKAVSDSGEFIEDISPAELFEAECSAGLYCFTRD
jgi:SAM-dependent methyltransferase